MANRRLMIAREKDGRPSRKVQAEDRALAPAVIKRIVERAAAGAMDARLGSVVGRMLLEGALSARQAGAAFAFGEAQEAYQRAICCPSVRSPNIERGRKSEPPEECSEAGQKAIQSDLRAVRRYERACAVLDACGDGGAYVRVICSDLSLPDYASHIAVRRALDALASHFSA